ncbi:MAG TPA: LacI family DNA-binding transcriptional regulator [Microlunatus sp.]
MAAVGSRPTITTVAERAGVSPMTVSRVLAGGKNVRPELSRRVLEAVDELGYRRNEQARSLRPGQRSGLIGVAITNLANPYYAELLLGADKITAESGRTLIIGSTDEDEAREQRLIADFIGRQVEGLIVVPTGARRHLLPSFLGSTPLVLASRAVPGVEADTVLVADVQASYQQTSTLIREGHRRIGFLGTMTSVFTGRRRFDGFRLAHEDADVELQHDLVRVNQLDVAAAEQAMRELLADDDPPTAVFCANNRNALGAVRALLAAGTERAAAIRVVSFDQFELADLLRLPITVIAHDAADLGRRAASMLLRRISEPDQDWAPQTIELPTRAMVYPPAG